jgi:RHS repeat-associated protein
MFVSNENATLLDIYFDDVTMSITKGNIVQYNEYYPFGLQTANLWTREHATANNFLGNGGTELNQVSPLYDLEYRNYDPVLGRMNGVDPMAGKYSSFSPYNFSFNDPANLNDPSGADPYTINYSASVSQYHTGYTYDDRIDYHYTAVYVDGQGWRNEVPGSNAFYAAASGNSNAMQSGTGWGPGAGNVTVNHEAALIFSIIGSIHETAHF